MGNSNINRKWIYMGCINLSKMNKLVTIIIPVYKVEKYLDDCLISIVNQTYKKLEIILVDDGSPDSCPSLCEQWAEKDTRIKVIHKKNGGLSSARNAGLKIATGDFIGFVDSDDWVEPDMYAMMVKALEENDVDFVACKISAVNEKNGLKYDFMQGKDNLQINHDMIIDKFNYQQAIVSKTLESAAWNKLYRKEYLGMIRFKEGRYYEDYLFNYFLSKGMSKMLYIACPCYNYRIRENSICSSGNHFDDWELDFNEIEQDIVKLGDKKLEDSLNLARIRHYQDLCKIFVDDTEQFQIYRKQMLNVPVNFLIIPIRLRIKYALIFLSSKWLIKKLIIK